MIQSQREIKCRASDCGSADNGAKKKKKETQAAQLAGIVCSVLYWSVANLLINGRDKCVMADPLSLATHTHTVH